jgi:hypothetical protein
MSKEKRASSADFVRAEQKQKDAALAARGRAMHDSHRRQWESLKRTYAEGKAKIYGFGDTRRQQTADASRKPISLNGPHSSAGSARR